MANQIYKDEAGVGPDGLRQAMMRRAKQLWEAATDPTTYSDAARGLMQGASFGFADEVVGAALANKERLEREYEGEAAGSFVDDYRRHRDQERAEVKAARERSPVASVGGNIAGGFAMPAGVLGGVKGAAISGGLGGLGGSDADLTRGQVGQAVLDSGLGAGTGAAFAGAMGAINRRIIMKRNPKTDEMEIVSSDLPDAEKYPFLNQEIIEGDEVVQPRYLYHGSATPAKVLADGMVPQTGAMTGSWYGDVVADAGIDELKPLLFFDPYVDEIGSYSALQTSKKIGKPWGGLNWDDLRKHGSLAVVDTTESTSPTFFFKEPDRQHSGFHFKDDLPFQSEDFYEMGKKYAVDEIDDTPIGELFHVEPTDFVTADPVHPNWVIDGDDLVDLLSKYSKNPNIESIRQTYGMPEAMKKRAETLKKTGS